jgi:hypothetical protein
VPAIAAAPASITAPAAAITTAPAGIAAAMAAIAESAVMPVVAVIGARRPRNAGVAATAAGVAIRTAGVSYDGRSEQQAHDCDDDDDGQ